MERNQDKDEDTEEESEEEIEPKLKYDRLGSDLNAILSKDAASCMAVHPKFLALGTHWGMIHILDHAGNNIRSKEINAHSTTVNQISIDENGDYMASCSDDGKVVITGLYATENNQVVNFDRPVKAVSVDPNFYKPGSGKHYVTGDDKLVLNEKGFFNRHKTIILHQGEGPIRNIKWQADFIAWSNDLGVKIYDMTSKTRITHINKDHEYRPDLFVCNLCWKDDRTLLIGWGDKVKICVIKQREPDAGPDFLPNRYVEIVKMFTTEFFICGIAPQGDNLVVLSYEKDGGHMEGGRLISSRPHLQILEPHMDYFEEVSNDALSIRGFTDYRCNDYHLECIIEENLYYIISPKDVVVSKQRDDDDHITWLVEHELFEEAMQAAMIHGSDLKKHNFEDIGHQYLNYLLEEQEYEKAAENCSKILGRNKELWENEVYKFAEIHQLRAIAPFLPRENPRLNPAIYEMVLNEFLLTDYERFKMMIKEWPHDLYNIKAIVCAVMDRLDRDKNNQVLMECLGELYINQKAFDKALVIYLKLQHKDVFKLIQNHDLFEAISANIERLLQFDKDQAVKLLLDNMDKIPIEKVVQQLDEKPEFLHVYLDKLFQKDPHLGQKYHGHQVKLYAEFDRHLLLPFLRSSNYYPLQMALDVCEQRDYTAEQVFLLGRMGNLKQALQLITEKLFDVDRAIDFCKEHNDRELWEDLIVYSIDKPKFITGLLQNIGTHVDPIILIRRIQEGMEIPGLRDSLVKILHDYNLQISLREGCKRILVADSFNLMNRLIRTQKRAVFVDNRNMCPICQQHIIINDLRYASNVIVFNCRHVFHEDCLPVHSMERCTVCSTARRGPGSKDAYGK